MAHAFAQADGGAQTEYLVYVYHHLENQHEGHNDWEKRSATKDLDMALREAKTLHESKAYRKVEIKQRRADRKTRELRDYTFKVFAHGAKGKSPFMWLRSLAGIF